MTERVELAVVGGGVSGLAAAWEGRRRGAEVVVLEASERVGGALLTSALGGLRVDEGADAFLARVPEAVELCRELGIEGELVAPATGSAYVWSGGALRQLPAEQLLGVPTDLDALADGGIVSPAGVERARADLTLPDDRPAGDEAVGALVRRRLGDEVLDKLVGPLIGGIWAGDADHLSLQTAAPTLAAARDRDPSLLRGAAAIRAEAQAGRPPGRSEDTAAGPAHAQAGSPSHAHAGERPAFLAPKAGTERIDRSAISSPAGDQRPVFLAPQGGMGRLVEALVGALGDRVRSGAPVKAIEQIGSRWRLEPIGIEADAVVLATPAHAAAPLLSAHAPDAAGALAGIEHATVAIVSLVVPRAGIGRPLDGSGLLVPRSEGRLLTACSWASTKWAHLSGDGSSVVLRASAGNANDDRVATLPDDALVAGLLADLRDVMALHGQPTTVRVSRWPRSFPQPRPGHLDAVAGIEAELARATPGLTATGAWARGVGVPTCIRGARAAATRALSPV